MTPITMAQLVEHVCLVSGARRLDCGDCAETIVFSKDPDESLEIVRDAGWLWDDGECWPVCPKCVDMLVQEACEPQK